MNSKKFLDVLGFAIPLDYRESCIGDLYEMNFNIRKEPIPGIVKVFKISANTSLLVLAGARMRIDDFFEKYPCLGIYGSFFIRKLVQIYRQPDEITLKIVFVIIIVQMIHLYFSYFVSGMCVLLMMNVRRDCVRKLNFSRKPKRDRNGRFLA